MIVTTKTYPSGATIMVLAPEEGFKYITNDAVCSTKVTLGKTDSIDNWYDTNDEPPIPEDDIPAEEALDIITGVRE